MENEHQETPSSIQVDSSGAAAASGGVAAGAAGYAAGRDIHNTQIYLISRGVMPHMPFMGDPSQPWDLIPEGPIEVNELRKMLLQVDPIGKLPKPKLIKEVKGTLYPCALLSSGWWERQEEGKAFEPEWNDGVQAWLFHGFHEWGPSWNFTWDFESLEKDKVKPYFIAQLGDGDESNSITVIIPHEKAKKLHEEFRQRGGELRLTVSGLDVEVTGLLCHRPQFLKAAGLSLAEAASLGLRLDILDYCIWLKEGETGHKISLRRNETKIYSGYLWKCVAPKNWFDENKSLGLNQVYFIWEHTNFVDKDAIDYNLDSLKHKESYIIERHGELVLLQKSSLLVPDEPKWSMQDFYDFLVGKKGKEI